MGKITRIVWNGCDSYIECDEAALRGYDYIAATGKLYTQREEHSAFGAVEIDPKTLPRDADGDLDGDGVFATETGRFYRQA